MENEPMMMINSFKDSDMYTRYIDELLQNMNLDKEYVEILEKKK